ETLANNDIFVRVMAMPFYGDANDLQILKNLTFNVGAKAIKNKSLNYFDWNQLKQLTYADLIQDKIKRISGRPDFMDPVFVINSGETILVNGQSQNVKLIMPIPKVPKIKLSDWAIPSKMSTRLKWTTIKKIDCGYSQISKLNWGYIL
ncbi:MAG: hypothetical protein WCI84_11490, partial [Bacteroidota bacterium]